MDKTNNNSLEDLVSRPKPELPDESVSKDKREYYPYAISSFGESEAEEGYMADFDYDIYGNKIDRSSQIGQKSSNSVISSPKIKKVDLPSNRTAFDTYEEDEENKGAIFKIIIKALIIVMATLLLCISLIGALILIKGKMPNLSEKTESVELTENANLMIDNSQTEGGGEAVKREEAESPMFTATGYYDMQLNKGDCIFLSNDAENKSEELNIYLQYIITEISDEEGEKPILTTGLIEPGMQVSWSPAEELKEGTHKIHIVEQPYTLEGNGEFIPRFSCDQTINITIK